MTFALTIDSDRWHADVFQDGSAYAVLVHVGYCDEEPLNYFVHTSLETRPGGDGMEFVFYLIEANGETGTEHAYWSGRDVAKFITQDDRSAILRVVCAATGKLLDQVKPSVVYRYTHDADLPDKALEKHHVISKVFTNCGYRVIRGDEYHGHRMWRAERL